MATISFRGNPIHTSGTLPAIGSTAPDASLTGLSLEDVQLSSIPGRRVLNIFPSIDTGVCATSVRTFNSKAVERSGVQVLNVSMDLPFALKRFCGAEGIENVASYSAFRSNFASRFGLLMTDGPLAGLCSRVVIVLDEAGKVIYTEQVPEIGSEPNYDAALAALG